MDKEIKEYIIAKGKPISHCVDLTKYFIGRHETIPVYLTPNFEIEFNSSMQQLENLKDQVKKQKEVIDKINKYINNYDIFKVFSFPLMEKWKEQQVKSSIDYEFKASLIKDLKDILKEVSE